MLTFGGVRLYPHGSLPEVVGSSSHLAACRVLQSLIAARGVNVPRFGFPQIPQFAFPGRYHLLESRSGW
jgi:hypothetical protein